MAQRATECVRLGDLLSAAPQPAAPSCVSKRVICLKHLPKAALAACLSAAMVVPAAHASTKQDTFFEAPRDLTGSGAQPSTDATRAAAFADMASLGVKAIRVNLPWYGVAPTPDSSTKPAFDATDPAAYNWGNFGTAIDEAKKRGWKVLISPAAPVPKWATAAGADTVTRPKADEFKLFTTAAAKRFGGPTVMWSIWNEPNLPRFLKPQVSGGKRVAGAIYRDLFIQGRQGIRDAGQTAAPVLFGETAPVGGANDDRTMPLAFLRDALCVSTKFKFTASCGALKLDGVAHHPYQFSNSKLKADDVTYRNLARLTQFLDKAAKSKAINAKVPVYFTEFGIQSTPDKLLGKSPQEQLELRARAERDAYYNSRVRGFSQYLLTDDLDLGGFQTGLRYAANGKAKPAFDAFRLVLDAKPVTAKKVSLWGLVRPATTTYSIVIEKKTGKSWKRWKTTKLKSNGAFSITDPASSKKTQYRYRWTGPEGKLTSPYVRVLPA